jgi:hypothetical protein
MMPAESSTTPVESANLILKLYELRREETMRQARNYVFTFNPTSADEYLAAMGGPHSASVRMVASYWEMACSFVVNGAIDATMFDETNGEHIMMFGKIEPFLEDLRAKIGSPNAFKNLEQVCTSAPGGIERVRAMAARMRAMAAARPAATSA